VSIKDRVPAQPRDRARKGRGTGRIRLGSPQIIEKKEWRSTSPKEKSLPQPELVPVDGRRRKKKVRAITTRVQQSVQRGSRAELPKKMGKKKRTAIVACSDHQTGKGGLVGAIMEKKSTMYGRTSRRKGKERGARLFMLHNEEKGAEHRRQNDMGEENSSRRKGSLCVGKKKGGALHLLIRGVFSLYSPRRGGKYQPRRN